MAVEVTLPRLGQGMESGTIVKWLKSEGDAVEKGEPLYELDTDKVTQEVEADASGVLLRIAVREGEVEVGNTIALIGEKGEEVPAESPDGDSAKDEVAAAIREEARKAEIQPRAAEGRPIDSAAGRVKASPLARRIARERGIDLASLTGTGPEGRVVAEDVERGVAGPPRAPAEAPGEVEVEQLSSLRKTMARRLTQAWEAPAFQISMSADVSRATELRERYEADPKPTFSDVLTRCCASVLMRHRAVNAHFEGDAVRRYPTADIGIAVATERGLLVPVIRECERKTLAEIAAARADLVTRAREGKLQQADLEGGTFTISNLGMYGVEHFTAVLNPPQVAILAVGAIEERPVIEDGELVVRPLMSMTMTCDHRAVDGAVAAEFLQTLQAIVEEPGLAL